MKELEKISGRVFVGIYATVCNPVLAEFEVAQHITHGQRTLVGISETCRGFPFKSVAYEKEGAYG